MGQITVRLTDEIEIKLKREAKLEKKSLAEYCREKLISEEDRQEPAVERVRLEYRMDQLEKKQEELYKLQNRFMKNYLRGEMLNNGLMYKMLEAALDTERATEIWKQVEERVEIKMKKLESGS